ncbi:aminopeptidase [Pseudalgibacter alginicilyticus]|uniref:Aminopeptidase N n=1 Tax=Pseudalgibacter alginicilyticus TaxID=1736674 RepID=A0A0P0CD78_9FLAO|nr:M1 family metallopeptidase [Pseudalgibacter alginicilyticus]ALJ03833.1 aminopeptidase [Pseudalgibacter alginicilyticus]
MKYFLLFFVFSFFSFSQQSEYVDFKTAKADIAFGDLTKKEVFGTVLYEFEILKDTDSIFLDAENFKSINYVLDAKFSGSLYNGNQLIVKYSFKANTQHTLYVTWRVNPNKAMYFIDWEQDELSLERGQDIINKQVWTQGQGKYTSNWLPSIDDMNDKIEFDLSVTFDSDYEVIANGKLINKQVADSVSKWYYDMQHPMSSYLVALAIGKYNKKVEISNSGVPLEMYYYPQDSIKFESTYRYTKQMFDFLEDEIGVPYPWQNYKQVPVKDFLYAGMENTSTTIFSDAFMVDSIAFIDKNYVNVNAHELAHQWFGNLITETSGTHHWLQEGFATYYALLAERNVFGDDYYYWSLYQYAQELLDQDRIGESTSLLDPKSTSITFYKKGALVLHLLREKIGNVAFKKAVKNYIEKHEFNNVETNDFIREVEKESGKSLGEFVELWLKEKDFKYDLALESLKKSVFIQEYLMVDCEVFISRCKDYLNSGISDEAKSKIVSQSSNYIQKEDFKNSLKVRQTIAQSLTEIPIELKKAYESLLKDESYITKEIALFNLWKNFPEERKKYLNKTREIQGFNDKNIRTLWLTLALITDDFELEKKSYYFNELTDYTSAKYGFETRINAFRYLTQIQACQDICKENLEKATTHHNWQFAKLAKELLKN